VSGLGDIILMPLMLNYNVSPDINWNFRFSIFAPTGSYGTGRLANHGQEFLDVRADRGIYVLRPEEWS
jgi:hypothetical protein